VARSADGQVVLMLPTRPFVQQVSILACEVSG
jgi:hypothetical protein